MKEKIEKFLATHNSCKITDIIAEFLIDYKTVMTVLSDLYNERKVKQVGDNAVKYYAPAKEETDEEEDEDEDEDNETLEADNIVSGELDEEFDELLKGPTETEKVVNDLFAYKYNFRSKKQMENQCMDVIEKIAAASFNITRNEAIEFTERLIELANNSASNQKMKDVFERVLFEFRRASDEEYDNLRKQLL